MLPSPMCLMCWEGAALQAAGAFPPGVPFCLEHELGSAGLDDGGTAVSNRAGVGARLFARWQVRMGERVFGWTLPFVAVVVGLLAVARLTVRRPRSALLLVGAGAAWWSIVAHPAAAMVAVATAVQVGAVWPLVAPRSCQLRALGWVRSLFVYRRLWAAAMHVADLERRDVDGHVQRPRFRRVRCLERVDVVHVRGLLGQRYPEWEEAAPMLAHVFGASDYRLHRGDDRRLTLELVRAPRGRAWNRDSRLELEEAL